MVPTMEAIVLWGPKERALLDEMKRVEDIVQYLKHTYSPENLDDLKSERLTSLMECERMIWEQKFDCLVEYASNFFQLK